MRLQMERDANAKAHAGQQVIVFSMCVLQLIEFVGFDVGVNAGRRADLNSINQCCR